MIGIRNTYLANAPIQPRRPNAVAVVEHEAIAMQYGYSGSGFFNARIDDVGTFARKPDIPITSPIDIEVFQSITNTRSG